MELNLNINLCIVNNYLIFSFYLVSYFVNA